MTTDELTQRGMSLLSPQLRRWKGLAQNTTSLHEYFLLNFSTRIVLIVLTNSPYFEELQLSQKKNGDGREKTPLTRVYVSLTNTSKWWNKNCLRVGKTKFSLALSRVRCHALSRVKNGAAKYFFPKRKRKTLTSLTHIHKKINELDKLGTQYGIEYRKNTILMIVQ